MFTLKNVKKQAYGNIFNLAVGGRTDHFTYCVASAHHCAGRYCQSPGGRSAPDIMDHHHPFCACAGFYIVLYDETQMRAELLRNLT
jgi:hypothetical protein